eukprot:COSAG01_NODE_3618_length_5862_cov_7.072705_4_plen_64_part_00
MAEISFQPACTHAWLACPTKACTEVIGLSVRQLFSLDPACGAELSSQRCSTAQPGSNEGSQPY